VKPAKRLVKARQGVIAPIVWNKEAYSVTDDGPILVRVVEIQGPEWVRNYQRWSLRIGCMGMLEPVSVSLFLNLAGDEGGPSLPGRQSKFYKHWSMANGDSPRKGQAMNWNIFMDKIFVAEVTKVEKNSKGEEKNGCEVYSRISRFIRRVDI